MAANYIIHTVLLSHSMIFQVCLKGRNYVSITFNSLSFSKLVNGIDPSKLDVALNVYEVPSCV